MKTVNAIAIAAVGFATSASAFTLDFTAFAAGAELNNNIVVNVPGYGDVRFTEGPNNFGTPPTDLEITDQFPPFTGIGFENGEQLIVTFEGAPAVNIDFVFAGVGSGESFTTSTSSVPDNGTRNIAFSGNGAALVAVNFESAPVPEPSSTLLVVLGALGLVGRRRR